MLATGWQFVQRRDVRQVRATPPPLKLNEPLVIPGVDWSQASRHIVLAFTTGCHYCQESGPFYRMLSEYAVTHSDVQLIVVNPEPIETTKGWFNAHEIQQLRVVQENFLLLGFRLTPSIAFVDRNGSVTDMMVGKLAPAEQDEVLARLAGRLDHSLAIRYDNHISKGSTF